MPILVVLAAVVVLGLLRLFRGRGDSDAPARIVTGAANRLPAHRRDWGRAMAAELTQIQGRARRWRFTAGVLRVVLFPPLRYRNRVLVVAFAGLLITAAATGSAVREVPSLAVFVAVLGLLLGGYATVVASRSLRPRWSGPHVIVGAVALTGVAATIAAVVRIAVAHPAATIDHTHVFSVLFALALAGYLAFALTPSPLGAHTNTVLWWALAGALTSGAVWVAAALTTQASTAGVTPFLSPIGVATTVAASIGASAVTRSRSAGARAGLLAAILGIPLHSAVRMTAILHLQNYTLTYPYDVAAYPRSGYPDVASYVLSDVVGGEILAHLVLGPVVLFALALLGAAVGTGLHRLATGPTERPTG